MKLLHIIEFTLLNKVRHLKDLGPEGFILVVSSPHFGKNVRISNITSGNIIKEATEYLEKRGFNIIGMSKKYDGKDSILMVTDTFSDAIN